MSISLTLISMEEEKIINNEKENKIFKSNFISNRIFSIVIVGILLLGLIGSIFFLQYQQDVRSKASEKSISCEVVSRVLKHSETLSKRSTRNEVADSIKNYRQTPEQEKEAIKGKVKELLQIEKEYLVTLMREKPADALSYITDNDLNDDIESISQNCVPTMESSIGELQIEHQDLENGQSKDKLTLAAAKRLYISVAGKLTFNFPQSKQISVTGYKLDNEILIPEVNEETIKPATLSFQKNSGDAKAVLGAVSGDVKLAVILTTNNITTSFARNFYTTTLSNYYKQSSYGKFKLVPTVLGPYVFNSSCALYDYQEIFDLAVAKAGINVDDYDYIQVLGNYSDCGSVAGMAYVGGKYSGIKVVNTLDLTTSHELTHNLSARHAAFSTDDYGDFYNIMGRPSYNGQLNAYYMDYFGWFASSNIKTVTQTGKYIIEPLETTTTGLKALKILRGSSYPLYIEYRQPIGFDSNFANESLLIGTNVFKGALIHTAKPEFTSPIFLGTQLIDVTPPDNIISSALQVNQSYKDPITGVVISITGRSSNALGVYVTIPGSTSLPTTTSSPLATPTLTKTPTPTLTPTRPPINADLTFLDMKLTDVNGIVKSTFKVNEPIYVKVTITNTGTTAAYSNTGVTYESFYRVASSPITNYGTPSRPDNFYLKNGEFGPGYTKEYGSYPSHPNVGFFIGTRSFTISTTGSYTARMFADYDNQVVETNESNNQRTVTYTIVN